MSQPATPTGRSSPVSFDYVPLADGKGVSQGRAKQPIAPAHPAAARAAGQSSGAAEAPLVRAAPKEDGAPVTLQTPDDFVDGQFLQKASQLLGGDDPAKDGLVLAGLLKGCITIVPKDGKAPLVHVDLTVLPKGPYDKMVGLLEGSREHGNLAQLLRRRAAKFHAMLDVAMYLDSGRPSLKPTPCGPSEVMPVALKPSEKNHWEQSGAWYCQKEVQPSQPPPGRSAWALGSNDLRKLFEVALSGAGFNAEKLPVVRLRPLLDHLHGTFGADHGNVILHGLLDNGWLARFLSRFGAEHLGKGRMARRCIYPIECFRRPPRAPQSAAAVGPALAAVRKQFAEEGFTLLRKTITSQEAREVVDLYATTFVVYGDVAFIDLARLPFSTRKKWAREEMQLCGLLIDLARTRGLPPAYVQAHSWEAPDFWRHSYLKCSTEVAETNDGGKTVVRRIRTGHFGIVDRRHSPSDAVRPLNETIRQSLGSKAVGQLKDWGITSLFELRSPDDYVVPAKDDKAQVPPVGPAHVAPEAQLHAARPGEPFLDAMKRLLPDDVAQDLARRIAVDEAGQFYFKPGQE